MNALLTHHVTRIWLMLVAATGMSWWMGGDHSTALSAGQMASIVLVIALLKVRFVLRHFMEVKSAGRYLQLATDGWVVIVAAVLLYLYWR
jgi:hypothetical protein